MRSVTSKRAARFEEEEEGPRKRHASTDDVLDVEALQLYLDRTQKTLEDLKHKHGNLELRHERLESHVVHLQDEVAKVSFLASPAHRHNFD